MDSDEMSLFDWENALFLANSYQTILTPSTVHLSHVETFPTGSTSHLPLQAGETEDIPRDNNFDALWAQVQHLDAKCSILEAELSSMREKLRQQAPDDESLSVNNPRIHRIQPEPTENIQEDDDEEEEALLPSGQPSSPVTEQRTTRKYVRRPKADPNAPARPLTAYAAFANDTRKTFTGQGLSFTEMAKRIGERWQGITDELRELYMGTAQDKRKQYEAELNIYMQTDAYRDYQQYCSDFQAKEREREREKDASRRRKG